MEKKDPYRDLESLYSETEIRYTERRTHYHVLNIWIAWSRLTVFIGLLVFIYQGFARGIPFFIIAGIFLAMFILFVRASMRVVGKRDHYQVLANINAIEIQALNGNYDAFDDGREFIDRMHHFTHDLDIYGAQSIFQYMNRSYTHGGQACLALKLGTPLLSPDKISQRQKAVHEMASRMEWRQNFQAFARKAGKDPVDMDLINKWMHEPLFRSLVYPFLAFFLPAVFFTLLVLSIMNLVPVVITLTYLLIPLTVAGTLIKRTNTFQNGIYRVLVILQKFESLIRHIENGDFISEDLCELRDVFLKDGNSASRIIGRLGIISDAFESRLNLIVAIFLNAIFLWDIHCLLWFERWKKRHGNKILTWLNTVNEFDAISSFGTLAFNHPDFIYPKITGQNEWRFEAMGHPLIPREKRVVNNHRINGMGSIHIVTGPNMAGKSTFLRAIGVNLVLAQSGSPVCAAMMVFKPIRLFTSMRTTDSLYKNESYFYSELKRLKTLFELETAPDPVFFLLDEILKGTNSMDQTRGSMAIIEKLLQKKMAGLVATHNLSLGEMEEEHPDRIHNFCFEVNHKNDQLIFDYLLREGMTTNMNATTLMRDMGLI